MVCYLDYNATSPMRSCVIDAMIEAAYIHGNPSSVHAAGRKVRSLIESARSSIASIIGRANDNLIFTSSGTEADALAIRGLKQNNVLVSAIEHNAVLAAASCAKQIPVSKNGVVDLAVLKQLLTTYKHGLVCVMWANNETGVIQPVDEIARLAHKAGWLLHVDAIQGVGRLDPIAIAEADSIALSAHKIGGPPGIGALLIKNGLTLSPIITGGGQERGWRAGTENNIGIIGFARAITVAEEERATETIRLTNMRNKIVTAVLKRAPEVQLMGIRAECLCNTLSIALPGVAAEEQVIALDLDGIAVSAGSACSSGKVRRSHVLNAMYPNNSIAGQAIRISLGWDTTSNDIDQFLQFWGVMRDRYMRLIDSAAYRTCKS
ncbi:nitrogenase metalloclusters biosynthesis protein [Candidatus Endolissoclinum faulkneri L5]|uniref:Cysteine desulfurase n=1 Tax=Candidatus Endolissoclinum faulkneri L5 TaxID=1401328 RepID=V9TUH4_9PROT|nr:cysteine desulfurase family protein [Candidatus Endolissoclinum faulkneri]AHC73338.1 nitrogenase metalloclusters biosynthesis protein [Candidatus Endolissoclinum faulkneri L5]